MLQGRNDVCSLHQWGSWGFDVDKCHSLHSEYSLAALGWESVCNEESRSSHQGRIIERELQRCEDCLSIPCAILHNAVVKHTWGGTSREQDVASQVSSLGLLSCLLSRRTEQRELLWEAVVSSASRVNMIFSRSWSRALFISHNLSFLCPARECANWRP